MESEYYGKLAVGDRVRIASWLGSPHVDFEGRVGTVGEPGKFGHVRVVLDDPFDVPADVAAAAGMINGPREGRWQTITEVFTSHQRLEVI